VKAAYQEIARINARVRDKLLKRARKQGMVNQDEIIELVEAWKHAATPIGRHRQHDTRSNDPHVSSPHASSPGTTTRNDHYAPCR
jgi:hypothetical protein